MIPVKCCRMARFSSKFNHNRAQRPLLTHNNYSFYVMQPSHTSQVLTLITNRFAQGNPFLRSILLLHPQCISIYNESIRKLWTVGLSQEESNGLSLVVCNSQYSDQIIGAFLAKDFAIEGDSEDFKAAFDDNIFNSPIKQIQMQMIQALSSEIKCQIGQKGRTLHLNGAAIKKDHEKQGLLSLMMDLSCSLAREKGFKNSISFAENVKSETVFKKFNFQQVGIYDTTQAEYKGEKIFSLIDNVHPHKFASLWFKRNL